MGYWDFSFMRDHARVLSRALRFAENLSHKFRLYLELLLDSLFTNDSRFSDKVQRELRELMDDSDQRRYLEYAFLAKTVLVKFQRDGDFGPVSAARLGNLEFFCKGMFRKDKHSTKVDALVMHSLLQSAVLIKTRDGRALIRRFRAFALVDRGSFWYTILKHMSRHVYGHLDDAEPGAQKNSSFIKSVAGFFKMSKKQPKQKRATRAVKRSFRDIANFLFQMGLDFDLAVKILLKLGFKCQIEHALVEQIVNCNKSVLKRQLLRANKGIRSLRDLRSAESKRRIGSHRPALLARNRKSIDDSPRKASLEGSLTCFERAVEERLSKILVVIKLSVKFVVGSHPKHGDSAGVLDGHGPIKESQDNKPANSVRLESDSTISKVTLSLFAPV